MQVRFEPEAEAEMLEIMGWYEAQMPVLRSRFMQAVDAVVSTLSRAPYAYAESYPGVRRANLRHFPYCFFYSVGVHEVKVLACMHQHRDLATWPSLDH
ncbi:MAG: type II toxin-antitoxin system RelE/ParE family toxin [Pseudomonadota bacterium]|nr:type II toxin-antitoxin system RelE/ParE family toxin [Pseudomonadota bacterium]